MWRAAAHNTAGKQVTAPSADTDTLAGKDMAATVMRRTAPLRVVAPAAAAAVAVVAAAAAAAAAVAVGAAAVVEVEAVGVPAVGAAVEEAGAAAAAAVGNAGCSLGIGEPELVRWHRRACRDRDVATSRSEGHPSSGEAGALGPAVLIDHRS